MHAPINLNLDFYTIMRAKINRKRGVDVKQDQIRGQGSIVRRKDQIFTRFILDTKRLVFIVVNYLTSFIKNIVSLQR